MSLNPVEKFDDYECSGPRPPVPGGESRPFKMTEGSSSQYRESSPSYLKWARTLAGLLEDREGVELFKRYVEAEGGIHTDRLNFYFACEGLKQQTDPEKVQQMIGAIYRFLRKTKLSVPEDIRRMIKAGKINEIQLKPNIYDQMQQDVERIINETTYIHFLKSDIYLEHVRNMTSCISSSSSSSLAAAAAGAATTVPPQSQIVTVPTASTSCSSGGSGQLTRSFTLPTLHEDTELICDNMSGIQLGCRTPADLPMRLTHDSLLATEKRRLEVRPPGAHGYSVYNVYESYNPVSLQDSERQSFSSGQTDSDTPSISTMDGRPYVQRKQNSMESRAIRQNALTNKEANTATIIPRTQRMHNNKHFGMKPEELIAVLIPKLEVIKKKQDTEELFAKKMQDTETSLAEKAISFQTELRDAIREKLPLDDDNDQAILDQHVQRVWSDLTPIRSPGTMSPGPSVNRRRTHEIQVMGNVVVDQKYTEVVSSMSGQSSMRHSKSMPEHSSSRKSLSNKWPSMHTDSGISLFSVDSLLKKEQSSSRTLSRSTGSDPAAMTIASQLEEARRRLEDETRRSRRYSQHPQVQQTTNLSSTSASGISTQAPPVHHHHPLKSQDYTTVVFSFCDEEFPYRTKIPGTQPTLKQFKEYLPKKGNFRFFFKTACEDPDNPVIQEEIVSDTEILPLFEGKVMGLVKPSD